MEKYLSTKISCLSSYSDEHDYAKELKDASGYLTQWPSAAVLERANSRDPGAIVELAIRSESIKTDHVAPLFDTNTAYRYLSGCGTAKQSSEGALACLDTFTDPSSDPSRYVGDIASPELMAQAHSCAARAHYDQFIASSSSERTPLILEEDRFSRPETARLGVGQSALSYFLLAAHHANESVKLGLVSPTVLLIGLKAREIGEVLGADIEQTLVRAKRFQPLWQAISRRLQEIHEEERKRQKKVDRRPNVYVCAAEGCGIQGEKKAALRSCSGKCPPDLKPHYCSPECQKKVCR